MARCRHSVADSEELTSAPFPPPRSATPTCATRWMKTSSRRSSSIYPHTRQADLAEFDLIDNKLCGDWQGSTKCPEKESEIYEKYADRAPRQPRTRRRHCMKRSIARRF